MMVRRIELAHLRLEIEPELMSTIDRDEAVAMLRKLAEQLPQ
jgi:hypothetical protein